MPRYARLMKLYYVYILASLSRVIYIGMTSKFEQRLAQHRAHVYPNSFTSRYNVTRLVYFEEYTRVEDAIVREKQVKGWRRSKKVALIESMNSSWIDLSSASECTSRSTTIRA
jgi:putative endonuclease